MGNYPMTSRKNDMLSICNAEILPLKLASLWQIMEKFEAGLCCGLIARIAQQERDASTSEPRSVVPWAWIERAKAGPLMGVKLLAVSAGLIETAAFADRIDQNFNSKVTVENFMFSFAHLRELMESEMGKQLFLSIPSPLASLYENAAPMGDSVYSNFPSIRVNISEAGSCLACGRNNAAMHHLMLATEVGLRELGKDRQIPYASSGEIEFKQWGTIIGQIEDAVQAIQQWKNSDIKDAAHMFYNALLPELRSFNDGYRRHLAHARDHKFSDTDALALWDHVSRFFRLLSEKISEGTYTQLVWV